MVDIFLLNAFASGELHSLAASIVRVPNQFSTLNSGAGVSKLTSILRHMLNSTLVGETLAVTDEETAKTTLLHTRWLPASVASLRSSRSFSLQLTSKPRRIDSVGFPGCLGVPASLLAVHVGDSSFAARLQSVPPIDESALPSSLELGANSQDRPPLLFLRSAMGTLVSDSALEWSHFVFSSFDKSPAKSHSSGLSLPLRTSAPWLTSATVLTFGVTPITRAWFSLELTPGAAVLNNLTDRIERQQFGFFGFVFEDPTLAERTGVSRLDGISATELSLHDKDVLVRTYSGTSRQSVDPGLAMRRALRGGPVDSALRDLAGLSRVEDRIELP